MGSLNCSCQCLKRTQEDKKPLDLETKQELTVQENDINYIDIIIPPNIPINIDNNSLSKSNQIKTKTSRSNKIPLEVINEINGDLTKESFNDNEDKDIEDPITNKIKNMKLSHSYEMTIPTTVRSANQYLDNNRYNSNINSIQQSMNSKCIKRRNFNVKLIKKINPNIKDTSEIWRELNIIDIVPDYKLLKVDEEEIIYHGELYKFIQDKLNTNKAYCLVFVVLTKSDLSVYRSKESFIKKIKPKYKIPLFNLLYVDRLSVEENHKNKNLHHFYVEIVNYTNLKTSIIRVDEKILQNSIDDASKSYRFIDKREVDSSPESKYARNVKDSFKSERSKRMKLIDENYNDYMPYVENKNENKETTKNYILFASNNEINANNWACVINYFVTK